MSREFYSWEKIRLFLVKTIYADTNKSYHISSEINKLLKQYDDKTFVLNIGSGKKRLAAHVKNLDIIDDLNVDYVCSADNIPIESNSVDLIITQEAFEHIPNSTEAIKECYRILKNDGKIYFQVPFIVGYHPGPTDFYRFTKEGIKKLRSTLTLAFPISKKIDFDLSYRIQHEFYVNNPETLFIFESKFLYNL